MAQFTSTSEFDLDKRIQLTNEVPPYDMYDALNSTMKNDLWKWVLGSSKVIFNQPYGTVGSYIKNANDDFEYTYIRDVDATGDNGVYHKFVNGEEAENYGPLDSLDGSVGQQPKNFTKFHTMEINGVLLPEFDFLLHEVYRYLDTLYPDHYNFDQLLTPVEINDMILSTGTMLNYDIDNLFFDKVADNLGGTDTEKLHEATMLKIRNLRNNAFRRQLYGSKAGYRMFTNDIFQNISIYPVGTYLPIKEVPYEQLLSEKYIYSNAADGSGDAFIDSLKEWNDANGLAYTQDEYLKYIRSNKRVIDTYSDIYYKKFKLIDWTGDQSSYPEKIENITQFYGYNIPLALSTYYEYPIVNEIVSNMYSAKQGYPIYFGDNYDFILNKKEAQYRIIETSNGVSKYNSNTDLLAQAITVYKSLPVKYSTVYIYPSYNKASDTVRNSFPETNEAGTIQPTVVKALFYKMSKNYTNNEYKVIYNPLVKDTLLVSPLESIEYYDTTLHNTTTTFSTSKYGLIGQYYNFHAKSAMECAYTVNTGDYITIKNKFSRVGELSDVHMILDYTRGYITLDVNETIRTTEFNSLFRKTHVLTDTKSNIEITDSYNQNFEDTRYGILIENENGEDVFLGGSLEAEKTSVGVYTTVSSLKFNINWIPKKIPETVLSVMYSTVGYEVNNINNFIDSVADKYKISISSKIKGIFYIASDIVNNWRKCSIFNNDPVINEFSMGYLTVAPAYLNSGHASFTVPPEEKENTIEWAINDGTGNYYRHVPVDFTINKTSNRNPPTFTYMTDSFRDYCALDYKEGTYIFDSYSPRDYQYIEIESVIDISKEGYENKISFEGEVSRERFKTLSIGDIITGPSIDSDDDNLIIIDIGDNEITVNKNLEQSGTFILRYAINMNTIGTDISNNKQLYKRELLNNGLYKKLNPFENGLFGSASWPHVAKAIVDGLPDTSYFRPYNKQNSFAIVMRACHDLMKKDIVTEDPETEITTTTFGNRLIPSTIKYLNDLFVEYNISSVMNIPTKDETSSECLMSVDWLDYLDKNLLVTSRATDNVNVGAHLMMNTDTSGDYLFESGAKYTDEDVKVKFFTLGWPKKTAANDDWYVPKYAQIGNTTTHTFTSLAKTFVERVKKAQLYGIADYDKVGKSADIYDIYDEPLRDAFGLEVTDSHTTLYTESPILTEAMLDTATVEYYNIEKPLFEVPLGEYDTQVKYKTNGSDLCTTVQVSIYKQTFKNLLKYLGIENEDSSDTTKIVDNRFLKVNPAELGTSQIFGSIPSVNEKIDINRGAIDSSDIKTLDYLERECPFVSTKVMDRSSVNNGEWIPTIADSTSGYRVFSYPVLKESDSAEGNSYPYFLIWENAEFANMGIDKQPITIQNNSILINYGTNNWSIKKFQAVNTYDYSNTPLLNLCTSELDKNGNSVAIVPKATRFTLLDTLIQKYLISTGIYNENDQELILNSAFLYPCGAPNVVGKSKQIENTRSDTNIIYSDLLNKWELQALYNKTKTYSVSALANDHGVYSTTDMITAAIKLDIQYLESLKMNDSDIIATVLKDFDLSIGVNKIDGLTDILATSARRDALLSNLYASKDVDNEPNYDEMDLYLDWVNTLGKYLVSNNNTIQELNLATILRDLELQYYAGMAELDGNSEEDNQLRNKIKNAKDQLNAKIDYLTPIVPSLRNNIEKIISNLDDSILIYINLIDGKDDENPEPFYNENNPNKGYNPLYTITQNILSKGDIIGCTKINNSWSIFKCVTSQKFIGSIPISRLSQLGVSISEFSAFTTGEYSTYRIIDRIVSTFKLPRKYLTNGSYNFDFIMDPRFVGEGYEYLDNGTVNKYDEFGIEDESKLKYFNISKAAIYYDTINDSFYTYSNEYRKNTVKLFAASGNTDNSGHFSSETKKFEIKFNEQKYFKNVLYSTGIYQSKQSLNGATNSVDLIPQFTAASNLSFNSDHMSPGDRILGIKEIFLRSLYNKSLEPTYFTKKVTLTNNSIIGVETDKIVVGCIGDKIDKIRYANKISALLPENVNVKTDATNVSTITTYGVKRNKYTDIILGGTSFTPFKFYKNNLLLKGRLSYADPTKILPPADSSLFSQALKMISTGDTVIKYKVSEPEIDGAKVYEQLVLGEPYIDAYKKDNDSNVYVLTMSNKILKYSLDSNEVSNTYTLSGETLSSPTKIFFNDGDVLVISNGVLSKRVEFNEDNSTYTLGQPIYTGISTDGEKNTSISLGDEAYSINTNNLSNLSNNSAIEPFVTAEPTVTYSLYKEALEECSSNFVVQQGKLFAWSLTQTEGESNPSSTNRYWKYGGIPTSWQLIEVNEKTLNDAEKVINDLVASNPDASNLLTALGIDISSIKDVINAEGFVADAEGQFKYSLPVSISNSSYVILEDKEFSAADKLSLFNKICTFIKELLGYNEYSYTGVNSSNDIVTGIDVLKTGDATAKIILTVREVLAGNTVPVYHLIECTTDSDGPQTSAEISSERWSELQIGDKRGVNGGTLTYTTIESAPTAPIINVYDANNFSEVHTTVIGRELYIYGRTYSSSEYRSIYGEDRNDAGKGFIYIYDGTNITQIETLVNEVINIMEYGEDIYVYTAAQIYRLNKLTNKLLTVNSPENFITVLRGAEAKGDIITKPGTKELYYSPSLSVPDDAQTSGALVTGTSRGYIQLNIPLSNVRSNHISDVYLSISTSKDIPDQRAYFDTSDLTEFEVLDIVKECDNYKKANRVYSVNEITDSENPEAYPKYASETSIYYLDNTWSNSSGNVIKLCAANKEYFINSESSSKTDPTSAVSMHEPRYKDMSEFVASELAMEDYTDSDLGLSHINTVSTEDNPYIIFDTQDYSIPDELKISVPEDLTTAKVVLATLYNVDMSELEWDTDISKLTNIPKELINTVTVKEETPDGGGGTTYYLYNNKTKTYYINTTLIVDFTTSLDYKFRASTQKSISNLTNLDGNDDITDIYLPSKGYGGHRNYNGLWQYKQPWDIDSAAFEDSFATSNGNNVYLCDENGVRLYTHNGMNTIPGSEDCPDQIYELSLDDCDSKTKVINIIGKDQADDNNNSNKNYNIVLNTIPKSKINCYIPLTELYLTNTDWAISMLLNRDFNIISPESVTTAIVTKDLKECSYESTEKKVISTITSSDEGYKLRNVFTYDSESKKLKYNANILNDDEEYINILDPYYVKISITESNKEVSYFYWPIKINTLITGIEQNINVVDTAKYYKVTRNETDNYLFDYIDFSKTDSNFGSNNFNKSTELFNNPEANLKFECTDPGLINTNSRDYPIILTGGNLKMNANFASESFHIDTYNNKLKLVLSDGSKIPINPPVIDIGRIFVTINNSWIDAVNKYTADPNSNDAPNLAKYMNLYVGSTWVDTSQIAENHFKESYDFLIDGQPLTGQYIPFIYSAESTEEYFKVIIYKVNADETITQECTDTALNSSRKAEYRDLGNFIIIDTDVKDSDAGKYYSIDGQYITWNKTVTLTVSNRWNNVISGVPGYIMLKKPKYSSFQELLSEEGYSINTMEDIESFSLYNGPIIKKVNSTTTITLDRLLGNDLSDDNVHYLQFKLLTSKTIPFNRLTHNDPNSYVELPISLIADFTPDRTYFAPKGYISSPIKIGKNIYRSENFEAFNNEFYTNNNKAPIYECNKNGQVICYFESSTADEGYDSRALSLGEPITNGFIPLKPLYTSCKDWFKNKFWVEGSEQNPFWQVLNITSNYNNSIKQWQQVAAVKKYVKTSGIIDLINVPENEVYVTFDSPCTYDVNNDVTTTTQKDVYVNVKKGKVSIILYQPENDYYNKQECINSYGINAYSSFYSGNASTTVANLENNVLYDNQEIIKLCSYAKSSYTVNSLENIANPLDKDASIAAITELGLFNKDHVMIAYATFPPIEYRTDKQHVSFTCVINNGNFNGSE